MADLLGRLLAKSGLRPSDRQLVERWRAAIMNRPGLFFRLCRLLQVDKLTVSYLGRYSIDIDVRGGSISEEIVVKGSYQFSLMQAIAGLVDLERSLFVNVGANIGTTCLNAHTLGARRFLAFEPVSRNFALLEHNLRSNGIVAQLHQCALGRERSRAAINLHPKSAGRHSLKSAFENAATEEVAIEPLTRFELGEPFFLWIDTEGFEYEVLAGAAGPIDTHCIGLCVEITPAICGSELVEQTLVLLEARFDRFYAATGEPLAIDEVKRQAKSGNIAQLDLICLDATRSAP